ncbi:MAG: dihydroorotase [Pseudomonadota bacterium]|jgi:dihydroorotase|nr:dihydroorotase [Pseudomonadota bacterium]
MQITLTRPDDWHVHLRDGAALAGVVRHTAARFARAIVMPNLRPPIVTTEQARAYQERIVAALPRDRSFEPLMTLYLTDNTPSAEIRRAKRSGFTHAIKYYPAGATTHSEYGVTDLRTVYPVLGAMEEHGIPLLVHGEVTDPEVDIFDRECVFIDRVLTPLLRQFSGLKIVFEHITTKDAVDFVVAGPRHLAATLTAHHLLLNRNALFEGGIRPHHYCLPVLKRERDREALLQAATSGDPKFFLGTDSAPHPVEAKETACGCAGIYTAHAAIELYAEAFEQKGKLDKLEGFASFHGAAFYDLPRNTATLSLRRDPWRIPARLPFAEHDLVPFRAGELCHWKLETLGS